MTSTGTTANRAAYPIFLILAALFLAPEWSDLIKVWWYNVIYSHGLVVLLAVVTLLWTRRRGLDANHFAPSYGWLLLLLGSTLVMVLARAAEILTLRALDLPFLLVFWGCAIWGQRFLRQAAPAIMLLMFAIPIWDDMSPIFQAMTVAANQVFLHLVHIKATIRQFYITIPNGTFFVADGCSGVRYLMSGLFVASLYSILYVKNRRYAAITILIGGALSILANWVRVFGIIIVGYKTNMTSPMVHHHETWGWFVFVTVAMFPFFYITRRLEKRSNVPTTAPAVSEGSAAWSTSRLTLPILAVLLVATLPLVDAIKQHTESNDSSTLMTTLPPGNASWKGPILQANFWTPDFLNPDVDKGAIYISPNNVQVEFYLVGYYTQRQGHELIFYLNKLYHDRKWVQVSQRTHTLVNAPATAPKKVKETVLQSVNGQNTVLVWSWYKVGRFQSPNKALVKLVGGLKDLVGTNSGEMLSIAIRCTNDDPKECIKGREHLASFLYQLVDMNDNKATVSRDLAKQP